MRSSKIDARGARTGVSRRCDVSRNVGDECGLDKLERVEANAIRADGWVITAGERRSFDEMEDSTFRYSVDLDRSGLDVHTGLIIHIFETKDAVARI